MDGFISINYFRVYIILEKHSTDSKGYLLYGVFFVVVGKRCTAHWQLEEMWYFNVLEMLENIYILPDKIFKCFKKAVNILYMLQLY